MLQVSQKGGFKKTEKLLLGSKKKMQNIRKILDRYGVMGVDALSRATPIRTGLTARSWTYTIEINQWGYDIAWINENENQGANVAILIQYGHGTRTGGYVQGTDYINPAMKPIFDKMATDIAKEVSSL